jgi:hypothetical protein
MSELNLCVHELTSDHNSRPAVLIDDRVDATMAGEALDRAYDALAAMVSYGVVGKTVFTLSSEQAFERAFLRLRLPGSRKSLIKITPNSPVPPEGYGGDEAIVLVKLVEHDGGSALGPAGRICPELRSLLLDAFTGAPSGASEFQRAGSDRRGPARRVRDGEDVTDDAADAGGRPWWWQTKCRPELRVSAPRSTVSRRNHPPGTTISRYVRYLTYLLMVRHPSYTKARAHLKELLDVAARGSVATVRRDDARAAVVDADRLRVSWRRVGLTA